MGSQKKKQPIAVVAGSSQSEPAPSQCDHQHASGLVCHVSKAHAVHEGRTPDGGLCRWTGPDVYRSLTRWNGRRWEPIEWVSGQFAPKSNQSAKEAGQYGGSPATTPIALDDLIRDLRTVLDGEVDQVLYERAEDVLRDLATMSPADLADTAHARMPVPVDKGGKPLNLDTLARELRRSAIYALLAASRCDMLAKKAGG